MFEGSDIGAIVFDLDGTLVETEHLKAQAYADIIGTLTGRGSPEQAAVDLYRSMVGATDMVICEAMLQRFPIESSLVPAKGETSVEALHRQRMETYRLSYGTPGNLRSAVYDHNVGLLKLAADEQLSVGVATMSFRDEAQRVIGAIGLSDLVDVVVGVDDVANPKPAPDAFLLAMEQLGSDPSQALIVEDSPRGAYAAAASGARWLCVATEFSTDALRQDQTLDPEWIVWEPSRLEEVLARRLTA